MITSAMNFAAIHMKGCKPRLDDTPAIFHGYRVGTVLASFGFSPTTVAAGILHDIYEDTSVPSETIIKEFGPGVHALVSAVTNSGTESDEVILERVKVGGIYAMAIKLADNADNIRTIECLPMWKAKPYLQYAIKIRALGQDMLHYHPVVDWHWQELIRASKKIHE
jgi:GTP diphosphokinase / guanosine-3',5'-bis(diphosphate) 3'-diphosphatase